jgi:hypothetical protein
MELGPGVRVRVTDGVWKDYEGRVVGEVYDDLVAVEVPGLDGTIPFRVSQVEVIVGDESG